MYKLAITSAQEAVDQILNTAWGVLDFDENGEPTKPDLFEGFVLSLGSILEDSERPAEEMLLEVCLG